TRLPKPAPGAIYPLGNSANHQTRGFRMYETLNHYIDGKWVEPTGAKSQDVMNPAKDTALGKLGHPSKGDLEKATPAAEKGFQVWRKTPAYDRSKILRKAADLVRERADAIA